MIIQIETNSKTLDDLTTRTEKRDAMIMKSGDKKFSVFLQNTSDNDVFLDSTEEPTSTTGIILASGNQMTIDIYQLDDLMLVADIASDIKVMFL